MDGSSNFLCLALVVVMGIVTPAFAIAKEQVVVFSPVPPDKEQLVEDLLGRTSEGEKEDLLQGKISVKTDVRIAEAVLMPGQPKQLFILNEGYRWCGTDGCLLAIWERQGEDWRLMEKLFTQNDGALRVQDRMDHGYHRLVERRSMLVGDDKGRRKTVFDKPILYRWTGSHYHTNDFD